MILNFKNEKDPMLFYMLHPALIMIYCDLHLYMKEKHKVDLVITETITTKEIDKLRKRVSPAHRQARALDIRTSNLEPDQIKDALSYINNRWIYKKYHYTSNSGVKRLAYFHNGTAPHIHLSIGAQFQVKLSKKDLELLASQ